jgi:tRNA pseudouridine55 synthase
MPNRPWRPVDGILLLDKPAGLSSNRALQRVRRIYAAAKGGHTGSLDPLATGLLPICLGEATKIAGLLLGAAKGYETACRLGMTTSTDDADGEPLLTRSVPAFERATIERAMSGLRGSILQHPPVYSALKQAGVPMYRRARRGEAVETVARRIEVRALDLLGHADGLLHLRIECGAGTYVRSLVRDLGERLGCGAHVVALRRTWADPFREPRLFTMAELEAAEERGFEALDGLLLPIECGLAGQASVSMDAEGAALLRQGQALRVPESGDAGPRVVLDEAGRVVALGAVTADGLLRPMRVFNRVR